MSVPKRFSTLLRLWCFAFQNQSTGPKIGVLSGPTRASAQIACQESRTSYQHGLKGVVHISPTKVKDHPVKALQGRNSRVALGQRRITYIILLTAPTVQRTHMHLLAVMPLL